MTKQTKAERGAQVKLSLDRLTSRLRDLVEEATFIMKDKNVDPDHRVAVARALAKLEEADGILGESGL